MFPSSSALTPPSSPVTQELSFQVDGARQVKVLCVSQAEGQDDAVLGKTLVQVRRQ